MRDNGITKTLERGKNYNDGENVPFSTTRSSSHLLLALSRKLSVVKTGTKDNTNAEWMLA